MDEHLNILSENVFSVFLKINYINKKPIYMLINTIFFETFQCIKLDKALNIVKHQARQMEFFEIQNEKQRRTNQMYN